MVQQSAIDRGVQREADDKTLGSATKFYTTLTKFNLADIPELKGLADTDADTDADSPSAPVSPWPSKIGKLEKKRHSGIAINGKSVTFGARPSDLSVRERNSALAALDQDAFCAWVAKCIENGVPSKTVKTMMDKIARKHLVSGQQLIQHVGDAEELTDFIRDTLECNEVFFLHYLVEKIIDDHKNHTVPFENYSPFEFAQYVRRQSFSFPADVFRKKDIDGKAYCDKDNNFLIVFFRKECGFKAGTSRPVIANIDKYPEEPSGSTRRNSSTPNLFQNHRRFVCVVCVEWFAWNACKTE